MRGEPVLVAPPRDQVVLLSDLKLHLRVGDGDPEEDALISGLCDAATNWLDGWSGVLGRAIMLQTWRQDFDGPGPHPLALPDVVSVSATAGGEPVELQSEVEGVKTWIQAPGAGGRLRVTYSCGLPEHRLPAVQTIVKLLVGHWYLNREAVVTGPAPATLPMAVEALAAPLRWRPI